jgi:hypothetical protein
MSGGEVGMMIFEPGWRWSNDVKPIRQRLNPGTDPRERRGLRAPVAWRVAQPGLKLLDQNLEPRVRV